MATVQLNATPRENSGKGAARTLRSQGRIPAIMYGHKRQPTALSLNARDLAIPAGVEVLDDPDDSVCVVAAPRAVIEAAPATEPVEGAEAATAEPEIIGKVKTEEEEGEAEKKPEKKAEKK